ncbi:MAG: hypothetical protein E6I10_08450 [Chloroflexi bacterium]|nr:MAG: hypothetical protein E6I10_08450 [Chloroflexota bacterium]
MHAQRRCRLPARIALAALLTVTGLAGASVGAVAADGVTLTVHLGYQDVVKAGEWMPVTIDAKNTGAGVDGTLEVQEALNGQPGVTGLPLYHESVSLATGASKRIRAFVTVDATGATITARIVQNGRAIVSKDAASASTTSTLIGVLSDQPTSLDGFAAVHPASVAARVVHLRADDVAESAIPLRAFDILAIDDFATDSLTAGQKRAISDFVRSGGNLLLGTGAAWRKTLAGLSPAILPMAVTGTTSVSTALLGGGPVEVATGSTQTTAPAWLTAGSQPLLLERRVGAGIVTLASFDWNQEPVAGWSGTGPLLRQLIARAVFGSGRSSETTLYAGGMGPVPFGVQSTIGTRSSALSSTLGNLPGLDLPSLQLTGALVLLYVLLVGPVNYLVLGAMRRRALAWVTVPLIAVIAAGGAYGAGVFTKGRSVQANQITILHLQPGWDRAYQETYTGIMAPSRGDYQATITGSRLLISPIANNGAYDVSAFGTGSRSGIRIDVDNNTITLPGMTAFALSGFATESLTSAPQLAAHVQLVNGKLTGTIENHSDLAFTDAVLVMGDNFQTFGALRPGTTTSVNLDVKAANQSGQPVYTRIYGSTFFNGMQTNQPTDAQREDYAKTQILSLLLSGGSFNGISLVGTPMLVAWTHQPFQDVTVNGSHPRSTSESAVALSLPLDEIGTGSLPSGLVSGRIVDVVGDSQGQGPPGMLLLQSGSVTYEFSPGLAAGRHLTGAALTSSNPYMGKVMPAPGGTAAATVQSEVWDWSRSAWSEVAYQDNGTTTLPDSAVNPQTGLVRLRFSTTSGFAAGAITLSGTVK